MIVVTYGLDKYRKKANVNKLTDLGFWDKIWQKKYKML